MQKGFSAVVVMVGLVAVLIVVGGLFYLNRPTSLKNQAVIPPKASNTNNPILNDSATIPGWKKYTSAEGNYSVEYPAEWILEVYKDKFPNNNTQYKGHVVFQSRATTPKEKADDLPGLPIDLAIGSIRIVSTAAILRGGYGKISEKDFFNPNYAFWPKGDVGGGGSGETYSIPQEVQLAGKRAVKQISHPTTSYEWSEPSQITTTYYIWLGNSANEVVEIAFTDDNKNPNRDSLLKNFNQMLSTLKITQ